MAFSRYQARPLSRHIEIGGAVKDASAVALGRLRWQRMTPQQQQEHIRLMVAARLKRQHRRAKARGAK